ncbi:DUF1015 domain-containing protein [Puniceicoccales bacterium CK1056]|uniref:DUF1015 domain-containing protein n=1 Tax=Oceanipulchritudo coccoides TaxID=2706888 RepID=A0A6B2M2Y6_9BACT|nr:DUF1015 family protein [Oceanipulchritudo coccoides]NDV63113.1 DUF1015 domain-containing protein [Oceanipulchritudo coccoides]
MRIRSFQGLRPSSDSVNKLVSLPYDVVSTEEARALAAGNPVSMLHVVRAEIDFPEGTDPYSDEVYGKAVANFLRLQAEGHLVRESGPSVYVYQQQMGDHTQQGIVALSHVDDYEKDLIKKHEKTRVAKENDRTRLTSEMSANTGPVFLTYNEVPELTRLMQEASGGTPLYDLVADDGIRHTVWKIEGGEAVMSAFTDVPCTYVADGHHRAASAARVGKERQDANPNHTGEEDYNWFLTVLFPGNQLKILPYNRIVHTLNGLSAADCLERINKVSSVCEADTDTPKEVGDVRFYLDGKWYRIELSPEEGADPVSKLDVSMLQDRILSPILGIDDPRTSDDIDFVGGIRGTAYLKEQVDAGKGAIAFSMYPVSVEQLMEIADAGQIMAPKSTWFEPKLRSGFFVHTF